MLILVKQMVVEPTLCHTRPFRIVLKVVFQENLASPDVSRQERGWKLLMLLPGCRSTGGREK